MLAPEQQAGIRRSEHVYQVAGQREKSKLSHKEMKLEEAEQQAETVKASSDQAKKSDLSLTNQTELKRQI
jgi:hypothetical protein